MKHRSRGAFAVVLLSALFTAATPARAETYRGARRSDPVRPISVDRDLRDLPKVAPWKPGDPIKEIPLRRRKMPGIPARTPAPPRTDPLLATQSAAPRGNDRAFTTPVLDIAGQGYSGVHPPDTIGEIGPAHYIQMINGAGGGLFTVYDKTTGALVAGPSNLDGLGTGSCATGLGDPVVLFDRLAQRWLLTEFASLGNHLCAYVSKTADPVSGGWWAYDFAVPDFPDYPKYAVWPDGYYVGTNEGPPALYALDRVKMLAGQAATYQRLTVPAIAGFGFQMLQPADMDGYAPPADGEPAIFLRHRDDEVHNIGSNDPSKDFLELWTMHVDWSTPANTSVSGPTNVAITEIDSDLCGLVSFSCIPQPFAPLPLDPLREVVMWRAQYRKFLDGHEALVGNLATDVDGNDRAGVRWFELRRSDGGAWTKYQEGTYSPDATGRWMASAAMDRFGGIAVGYSVSSSSVKPGIRYAGRLVDDPLGTLPQAETVIRAGATSQLSTTRWGDYASMNVDPNDDCTMWFTTEYGSGNKWATRITKLQFDACAALGTTDTDGDGIPHGGDNCPNDANYDQVDWNANGVGDVCDTLVCSTVTGGGSATARAAALLGPALLAAIGIRRWRGRGARS